MTKVRLGLTVGLVFALALGAFALLLPAPAVAQVHIQPKNCKATGWCPSNCAPSIVFGGIVCYRSPYCIDCSCTYFCDFT